MGPESLNQALVAATPKEELADQEMISVFTIGKSESFF